MVQIKVNGDGVVPDGTILEPLYIDHFGDARLNATDKAKYGITWVFASDFKVFDEEEPAEESTQEEGPGDLYTVTLPIKDSLELHDLLQALPRSVVEKITLRVN